MLEENKYMESEEKEIDKLDNMLNSMLGAMASRGAADAECLLEGNKLENKIMKIVRKVTMKEIDNDKLKQISSLFKQTQKLLDDILEEE